MPQIQHISSSETGNFVKLKKSDPNYLDYAVAFTREINEKGIEEIEYYGELQPQGRTRLKRIQK